MRVLFLIQRLGWAFHNIARALSLHAPPGVEITLADSGWQTDPPTVDWDVVVTLWWQEAEQARSLLRSRRFVVCVYDFESWPDQIDRFRRSLVGASLIACANDILTSAVRPHAPPGVPVVSLPDGVDPDAFPLLRQPSQFVVGWTGNSHAVGAGRPDDHKGLGLIRQACAEEGVPLVVRDLVDGDPVPHGEMSARFYSQISCYACASVSEGTPNPVLEALSSGRPVVSTRVGLVPDVVEDGVNGVLVERSVAGLRAGIRRVRGWFDRVPGSRYPEWIPRACRDAARMASWGSAADAWWNALRLLCQGRRDPCSSVTAVLVSSGEPTETEALRRLQEQDLVPILSVVRNVRPMDAAFRAMAEQVLTPYFVQVDADMLLDPGAIGRLLRAIKAAPPEVAVHCEWLWGDLEEMSIQGVKIYRTEAVRDCLWRSSVSCEVDQLTRLRAAGRTLSTAERPETRAGCLGVHVSAPTPEAAFRRWRRLMIKRRAGAPVSWVDAYPARFRARFLECLGKGREGDTEALRMAGIYEAAWLGAVAGLHGPLDSAEADAGDAVCHPLVLRILTSNP